jgi:hypothetical protein
MIKEMLGIVEGILQDLEDDHEVVASLIDDIINNEEGPERNRLFQEMRAKLLIHSHAEDEVLYRRLKASQHEASRKFAQEGEREHQLVKQQLQKLLAVDDKMSAAWTEQLTELQEAGRSSCGRRRKYRVPLRARRVRQGRTGDYGNGVSAPQRRADGQWV